VTFKISILKEEVAFKSAEEFAGKAIKSKVLQYEG
jgi:hypothetical protein